MANLCDFLHSWNTYSIPTTIPKNEAAMNIFAKIKRDHDEARDVMEKILDTKNADSRIPLFQKLKVAILSHAISEEKTFYKELKKTDDELAQEVPYLKHEHKDAEALFEEIEELDPNSNQWWEKFGELRKALTHHMEEEEEKIFKDARKEIPKDIAKELGETMEDLEEKEKVKLKLVEKAA
jgi:hemerythrin superfamily protein